MSYKKDGGNEQNGFFWILGLLKWLNGFESPHTDWRGYLNMIWREKNDKLGNIWAKRIPQSLKNLLSKFDNCVNFYKDMLIKLKYVNVESLKNVIWADFSNFG